MIKITGYLTEKQNQIAFSCYQLMLNYVEEIILTFRKLGISIPVNKRLEKAHDKFCIWMTKARLVNINRRIIFKPKRNMKKYIYFAREELVKIEADLALLDEFAPKKITKDYSQVFEACKKHLVEIIFEDIT